MKNKIKLLKYKLFKITSGLLIVSSVLSCFSLSACAQNSNEDIYENLLNSDININEIIDGDSSNLTIDQFINQNFGSIYSTNDWLSNNKQKILNDLYSSQIELRSYKNQIIPNYNNGTIILKIYLENSNFQNRSSPKLYDLKLINFKKGFKIPNLKKIVNIISINNDYSNLTLKEFLNAHFSNDQLINNWLNDNKQYFFESSNLLDEISIKLISYKSNKDESINIKVEITNLYSNSDIQEFTLTGFIIEQLPALKKSLDISNTSFSQLTASNFVKEYLNNDKWLIDNKKLLFLNSESLDNISISLNKYSFKKDGSLDLMINVSNEYRNNAQTINLFGFKEIPFPEINLKTNISTINVSYSSFTSDEFKNKYFSNLSNVNDWLRNNKTFLFPSNADLNDVLIKVNSTSDIKTNLVDGSITINLVVSNGFQTINKTINLFGFKKVDALPIFINQLNINKVDQSLSTLTADKFIENEWNSTQDINNWFNKNKHLLFENSPKLDDVKITYISNDSRITPNLVDGTINVSKLKISNKYFEKNVDFILIGFTKTLPNINSNVNISSIPNLSQLSVKQFMLDYFNTTNNINAWLSQNKQLIVFNYNQYPNINIVIKPNTNPEMDLNNNSIDLIIVLSSNNLSKEFNLKISGFRTLINLPILKSNIDIGTINSSYLQLTCSEFETQYFNNETSINQWLLRYKNFLFNETINDNSLKVIITPNTTIKIVGTTIEINLDISNIDYSLTNQKLVLSNFKPELIIVPLPNLKNNISINSIDTKYQDILISKFVDDNFATENNINIWLDEHKRFFFDLLSPELDAISLKIKPKTLLNTSHSRDLLSIDVVISNGISSKYDKLTLTNFKVPTLPITNPVTPTPYSYSPHIESQLPRIDININNNPNDITKQYQEANFIVSNPNKTNESQSLTGKIKVRGNSTSEYPKKPYRIKLDKKASLLDLNSNNKFKDWVLLADWRDPSMLRNSAGLYLGQFLFKDFGLYSSDFRYVDVYINTEYQGMYLLCEQNEVSTNRVNIDKPVLNSSNIDIGYLLEMDAYADAEEPLSRFYLNYNNRSPLYKYDNSHSNIFNYVGVYSYSIKSKVYDNNQNDFISKYLENIYRICYKAIIENKYYEFNSNRTDIIESHSIKNVDDCISNVLDIESVVSMLILQEIVCDWDLANSSFYMSIDLSQFGDGKLKFQVPWDFDCAFGIRLPNDGTGIIQPTGLYAANSYNPWMVLLYKSTLIKNKIKQKWNELIQNKVFEKLMKYLDDSSTLYEQNYKMNFDKWKNIGNYARDKYEEYSKQETIDWAPIELDWWMAVVGSDIVPEATWKNVSSQVDAKEYLKNWLKERLITLNNLWIS